MVLAVVASLAAVAWGQSLEELAQKEKARRKAAATAKTFTNDDLAKPSPSPSPTSDPQGTPGRGRRLYQPSSAPPPGAASAEGGRSTEGRPARSESGESSEADSGGEAYWRDRAKTLRDTITKTQQSIADLEARIGQLQLDRDPNPPDQFDPNRLQKRDAERLKCLEEVERAKTSLAGAQQALGNLADEARQKGAPLSWVQ